MYVDKVSVKCYNLYITKEKRKMKLRKWVVVVLTVILMACLIVLAMDFTDLKVFVMSKIISVLIILIIAKIFEKYGILEA